MSYYPEITLRRSSNGWICSITTPHDTTDSVHVDGEPLVIREYIPGKGEYCVLTLHLEPKK